MSHSRTRLIQIILLLGIVLCGGLAIILLHDRFYRWIVLGELSATYLIWSIWHHYEDHTLSREVLFEYLAILGLTIVVMALIG
jgi:hypothetical protein